METGVSYFSSRTLRHVSDDLQEIIDYGCTYVVHCFTETDLAYYRDTVREVVAATHGAGLELRGHGQHVPGPMRPPRRGVAHPGRRVPPAARG